MATITALSGGGNWSASGTWDLGRAPLASDDVVLNASSGNVTIDSGATRLCRSLDCNGYTGTLTQAVNLDIGDATAGAGNRAIRFGSGMTFTATNGIINLISTSGTTQTITCAGKSFSRGLAINGAGSSYQLADNLTLGATLFLTAGTFDLNGFNVTGTVFNSNNSNVRTLTLGSGTISLSSIGTAWSFATTTNLTFSGASATIRISDTSASNKTFAGGGLTYGTLEISMGGTGIVTISGSNTFTAINRSGTGTKNVRFTAGTTQTTGAFLAGTAGNLITIDSSSAGSAFTLAKSGGGNFNDGTIDYISLKDCTGPAGTNYAGANSTNVSGNTNWTFTAPPGGGGGTVNNLLLLGVG